MSEIHYLSPNQVSESYEGYTHIYPKYGKSTTDPTYYEPAATRIANMKKASGVKLQGLYDFYSKDDVSKFNEDNFKNNIRSAQYDPRYNNSFLPEEVSQIANSISDKADDMITGKKEDQENKSKRIKESIDTVKAIQKSQKDSTEE